MNKCIHLVSKGTVLNKITYQEALELKSKRKKKKTNFTSEFENMSISYFPLSIGHFRITFGLFFKASLGAHLFI